MKSSSAARRAHETSWDLGIPVPGFLLMLAFAHPLFSVMPWLLTRESVIRVDASLYPCT